MDLLGAYTDSGSDGDEAQQVVAQRTFDAAPAAQGITARPTGGPPASARSGLASQAMPPPQRGHAAPKETDDDLGAPSGSAAKLFSALPQPSGPIKRVVAFEVRGAGLAWRTHLKQA